MRNLCNEFFYVFQVFRFFYLCLTQKDNDLSTNTYESLTEEGFSFDGVLLNI